VWGSDWRGGLLDDRKENIEGENKHVCGEGKKQTWGENKSQGGRKRVNLGERGKETEK